MKGRGEEGRKVGLPVRSFGSVTWQVEVEEVEVEVCWSMDVLGKKFRGDGG